MIRSLKQSIEPLYNKIRDLSISWFRYLPVKNNKIVFIQANGGGYKCNLKYIAEEMFRQRLPYDLVWVVEFLSIETPSFIRRVKFNRIKAIYEFSTAHVIITNSKTLLPFKKKPSQRLIYIPHGQPGMKCAEGDALLPPNYVENSKRHSSMTDVFVSMGTYHTQVLKDTFWVPEHAEIWECGFPRNDQYYIDTTEKQEAIRKQLHIPEDTHIAFYAPTFRDNNNTSAYDMDMNRLLDTLEEKTGQKWIFFVTLHPNFKWFKHPPYHFSDRIWNMSDYTDIHELMLVADIAITDYSSTGLDFANTRRPVFLYASDIDEYTKMRGLKEMYYKLPFTLCRTNDEINKAVMEFDADEYAKRLDEFQKIYGSVDDGHAAERFVKKISAIM